MANGDPVALPNLRDPQAMLARAKAQGGGQAQPQQRRAVSGLDAMVNTFASIEDPMARQIAKGLVETEISKALGFTFRIPDPEDVEAQRLVQQRETLRLQREITEETVNLARASLMDLPKEDPDLQSLGLAGADLDTLLESDPDGFIALANRKGFPVTRGALSLAGIKDTDTASAGPAFQQKRAEEQVGVLTTQAAGLKAAGDLAKDSETQTTAAKDAIKASFEALGADTDFIDSDFDTERGGLALADATDTLLRSAGPAFQRMAADGLLSAIQDDMVDFLEDAQAANGEVVVNDRPTFYAAASLLRIAKARGVNIGDQLKSMGLGQFVGFERRSFNDFMKREGQTAQGLGL